MLDPTNILTPDLAVITTVGLDHCAILGNTIEEIASDKSGIIKENGPYVLGPNTPQDFIQALVKDRLSSPGEAVLVKNEECSYHEENRHIAEACL